MYARQDYQEITQLRKSGRLAEAEAVVLHALSEFPTDLWLRRAAAWVYYDYFKQAVERQYLKDAEAYYLKIKSFALPHDETLLWNSLLMRLSQMVQIGSGVALELGTRLASSLPVQKPSEGYSEWLGAVLGNGAKWSGLTDFILEWDLSNLRDEDYLPVDGPDGTLLPSLAEVATIKVAEGLLTLTDGAISTTSLDLLEAVRSLLQQLLHRQPAALEARKLLQSVNEKLDAS